MIQFTREQKMVFDRDGVVELGPILSSHEADALVERLEILIAPSAANSAMQRRELCETLTGGHENSVIQLIDVYRVDELFRELVFRSDLVAMARSVLGPEVRLFRDQVFYKPPHKGGEVFLHQDNRYWHLDPPRALTVWVALDDVMESNGCVYFLKGSHHRGRVEHVRAMEGRSILLEAVADKHQGVPMPLKRGCATIHDCQILHWSPENHSSVPRRGYSIQYMTADVKQRGQVMDRCPLLQHGCMDSPGDVDSSSRPALSVEVSERHVN